MGFKLWSTNELLTSSDVNTYLAKQSVIVCTSGTRPSSPVEGMTIYETDTDWYVSWNGSAWIMLGMTVTGTYTPTLSATSSPNLGTGGTIEGRWTLKNGKWCTYRGSIQWGTSGTAGSGQYLVSLPFTSSASITNGVSNIGIIMLRDASGGPALRTGAAYVSASSTTFAMFEATTGIVTNAVPWTWGGSGDYISWTITYEIT